VVDDSQTMRKFQALDRPGGHHTQYEVANYVDVLSYILKRHSIDGIDLYFFNSSESVKNSRHSTKLATSVRKHRFSGASSPKNGLVQILTDYNKAFQAYSSAIREYPPNRKYSILPLTRPRLPKCPPPLSVYILTDGAWELGEVDALEGVIRSLAEDLRSSESSKRPIGIQFIRFGNHPDGIEQLEVLGRVSRSATAADSHK